MRDSPQPRAARRSFRRAPDEKRARILAVARACFSEQSYERTTTAEIARRSDVSEGTIFHHFGTKLGLLQQVAEQYANDLAAAMFDGVAENFTPMSESFERAYRFVEEEGSLGLRGIKPGRNPQPMIVLHMAVRAAIIARGTEILKAWLANGTVRQLNPELVARILVPAIHEMLVEFLRLGPEKVSKEYMEEGMRCIEGACALERPRH